MTEIENRYCTRKTVINGVLSFRTVACKSMGESQNQWGTAWILLAGRPMAICAARNPPGPARLRVAEFVRWLEAAAVYGVAAKATQM